MLPGRCERRHIAMLRPEHPAASAAVLAGDDGATTASKIEEALVAQYLIRAQHRVHVDVERLRELTRRREPLPRAQRSTDDLPADARHQLLEQRQGRCGVDGEDHDLSILFYFN